jgi:hypothetical protein
MLDYPFTYLSLLLPPLSLSLFLLFLLVLTIERKPTLKSRVLSEKLIVAQVITEFLAAVEPAGDRILR